MANNAQQKTTAESATAAQPAKTAGLLFLKPRQALPIYLAGAGLVILALGFAFYTIKKNNAEAQASRLLGVAQSAKQFEELLRQYPKSAAAPVAALALAAAQFSAGDYDGAYARYRDFSGKYPQHPLAAAAELGAPMCFEARGEIEKALAGYDAFLAGQPASFLAPQALFGKARCLQIAGRFSEARIVYENFIAANPESKWRPSAEAALQMLDRQARLRSAPKK